MDHVWVDKQDGEGEQLGHAITEPEGGDEKRDVTDGRGRLIEGLERHEQNDGRRGWRPA